MKIGFYLQNANVAEADLSHPLDGNPGVGGTEYMFAAIPYALQQAVQASGSPHEIVLLANSTARLPEGLATACATDDTLGATAARLGLDAVVIRYSAANLRLGAALPAACAAVYWTHNFVPRAELTQLARAPYVKAIVCVGTEQLHFYRDHSAYAKSVVIFNGYPVRHFADHVAPGVAPFASRGHEVTFLGNIVDFKGFHLLADAWPRVVAAVPDAHLNVIGGARLYDRSQSLGPYGIAEKSYEERFMPALVGSDGKILPSVTFHGVLGNEKDAILNRTRVGVPNPSGVSETFCIAALELQLWGAVIATIDYGGFRDTVGATGVLYRTPAELADAIIRQLRRTDNAYEAFVDFARRFDFEAVALDWLRLFDALAAGEPLERVLKPAGVPRAHARKEFNRRLKRLLPFGRLLPSAMFYSSLLNRINIFNR